MTGATSPILRARNAKFQTKRFTQRNLTPSTSSHSDQKMVKPVIHPYMFGALLVLMSGGAIFQILKMFGLGAEVEGL
ncbi:hypothetical protein BG011_004398 [Mortierella polycephala]|uniref:Stress-associated endoplasmic reticulum protein n=1 Tax=Mortierella polycephala TaxID=41804 RepID=A0A9P6U9R8_9FUNG|nr:hypothetical protein BG011_004398 [Mortierella polycephala]